MDIVVESTGRFVDRASAGKHLEAGAKKVVITAPATNPDVTVVLGVNDRLRSGEAPRRLERLLHDELPRHGRQGAARRFGIRRGYMTTIHSYTNDQNILDFPHKDLRRARARRCR